LEENKELRKLLTNIEDTAAVINFEDSTSFDGIYLFRTAKVINNNYSKTDNYITLDRGTKSLISREHGVITSQGIVGIVDQVSKNYSRVISILNSHSRINAQLKKTHHFGSLTWNGKDPNVVQLIDVPRLAPIKIGDTIVTGGKSLIFPQGIPIGQIENFKLDQDESYFTIEIRLFNDMTNIGYVYVIENKDKKELKELEGIDD
jgi:rod shape-determining protein MreC